MSKHIECSIKELNMSVIHGSLILIMKI